MRQLLLFWLTAVPTVIVAQENSVAEPLGKLPFTLKISVLELINPMQTVLNLHADIPLSEHWVLDLGIGAIVESVSIAKYAGESYRGWKYQPEIKYFSRASQKDSYISMSFKYMDVYSESYRNTLRQGGQYTEWLLQRKHRVTKGLSFRVGFQQYTGKRKRILIDPFFGVGIRRLLLSVEDLPPDAVVIQDGELINLDREPGKYMLLGPVLGLNVGWAFGRRP